MFRYYLWSIAVCSGIIFGINCLLIPPHLSLAFTALTVVGAFLIDAVVALFVRYAIPKKYYSPFRKRFACARWEKKLYMRLGIRKWKDKIPETGGLLVGFSKTRVLDMHDNEYILKFMSETCYAEVMHMWSALLGFSVLFLVPSHLRLTLALPVATVNAVLQILPVFVQRFIRPQLLRVYASNAKRLEKATANTSPQCGNENN